MYFFCFAPDCFYVNGWILTENELCQNHVKQSEFYFSLKLLTVIKHGALRVQIWIKMLFSWQIIKSIEADHNVRNIPSSSWQNLKLKPFLRNELESFWLNLGNNNMCIEQYHKMSHSEYELSVTLSYYHSKFEFSSCSRYRHFYVATVF